MQVDESQKIDVVSHLFSVILRPPFIKGSESFYEKKYTYVNPKNRAFLVI